MNQNAAALLLPAHKRLMTSLVLPTLSVVSILCFLAFYEPSVRVIGGILGAVGVAIANIWLTKHNRIFRAGKLTIESRSDYFDFGRWMVNLALLDPFLTIMIAPREPAVTYVMMLFYTLAACLDTYGKKYRTVVAVTGVASTSALLVYLYPHFDWQELLFFTGAQCGILWTAVAIERRLVQTMALLEEKKWQASETEALHRQLQLDASLGYFSRTIMHELSNVSTILAMNQHQKSAGVQSTDSKTEALSALARATHHIQTLCHTTLTRLPAPDQIESTLDALIADIRTLIRPYVESKGIAWSESVCSVQGLTYQGKQGGLFLLLLNLVKNAVEAIAATADPSAGAIDFSVVRATDKITFTVRDNGTGFPAGVAAAIMSNSSISTTKAGGSGLGLSFVLATCSQSGYQFHLEESPTGGTTISITVPVARADRGES